MINRVVLVGRLTKDPELRYTPNGVATTRFILAVNRQFKKEGQPEADFINCVAWQKQAENLCNFMKKGSLIGLDGRIQTGSYEGQDGKRVFTTDIVAESIQFLESKPSGNAQQQNNMGYQQPQQQYQQQPQQQYGNQPPQYGSQQQYGGQQQFSGQQNYMQTNHDPFANSKGPIQVDESDLPF